MTIELTIPSVEPRNAASVVEIDSSVPEGMNLTLGRDVVGSSSSLVFIRQRGLRHYRLSGIECIDSSAFAKSGTKYCLPPPGANCVLARVRAIAPALTS